MASATTFLVAPDAERVAAAAEGVGARTALGPEDLALSVYPGPSSAPAPHAWRKAMLLAQRPVMRPARPDRP
jgi:hypothetical protein